MDTISVGVDGSEGGNAALDFAVEEAALRGARLKIVVAWQIPPAVLAGLAGDSGFFEQAVNEARQRAEEIAAEAMERAAKLRPSVTLESRIVEGHGAKALLEECDSSSLLVVGSRGRGGFTGLLMGSTSQQVVSHSRCPVVVIPGGQRG